MKEESLKVGEPEWYSDDDQIESETFRMTADPVHVLHIIQKCWRGAIPLPTVTRILQSHHRPGIPTPSIPSFFEFGQQSKQKFPED
jgi:hypothetical protein